MTGATEPNTVLGVKAPPPRPTIFGAFVVAVVVTLPFAVLLLIF
ncbi:hypothetical protein [Yoonia sp. 2307UL14-13]